MKHILVVWENSRSSDKALRKANLLAKHANATVKVVSFIGAAAETTAGEQKITALSEQLENSIDQVFEPGIDVTCKLVDCDDIADWICQACKKSGFDLVIKAKHKSKSVLYSPTDWKLIRQLAGSLLLIDSSRKKKGNHRVLITLDVKSTNTLQQQINTKVLNTAKQWANYDYSHLHATYIIPIAKALEELVIVEAADVVHKKGAAAYKKVQNLLQEHAIDDAEIHISAGNPAIEIASVASKTKADLVIMGSVGRKGLKGLLLGNTAEKIINNLHTDLLVIKP